MTSKTTKSYRRITSKNVHKIDGVISSEAESDLSPLNVTLAASGADNAKWRALVKNHREAGNIGSSRFVTVAGAFGGQAKKTYTTSGIIPSIRIHHEYTIDGYLGGTPTLTFGTQLPSSLNAAKAEFCAKAVKKISPFSGGVFLGELREAIHMIRHPAESLFNLVKDQYLPDVKKRRKRAKPKDKKKTVASTWLEYVFGWAPLLSDVKSGAETVARCVGQFRPNEIVSTGKIVQQAEVQPPTKVLRSWGNISWYYHKSIVDSTSQWIKGAVRIAPAGSLQGDLDMFGIGWEHVLPTAWELLPMSFVIDYFSNVGAIIESASILNGKVIYCDVMTKTVRKTLYNNYIAIQGAQTDANCSVSGGNATVECIEYSRAQLSSPVPSLQFKCPGVNSLKWLNLGALFTAARG